MHLTSLLTTSALLVSSSQALYFYLDGTTPKCFYEELPKDTLVVGTYKAEAFNQNSQSYITTNDLAVQITVDETFDNDHRVVSQTSTSSDVPSKFTFSAADSGLHRLCFTPSGPAAVSLQGWFSGQDAAKGGVKIWLDMAIGESSKIESDDKNKIDSIVGKVRELNSRLADIRREQVFQREREAEFRDQSESVNSRIVKWTLIQLVVLGGTCAWQLSHLRSFFIKQKLT
ncbi:emp24p/erv25p-related protein [Lithohypha guttulata]|uniref:emp24p/erv25p-related protein n=1 Tax=Lithohypha guttulata TaxID=1690604 RepID=UPI002DE1341B|nr:emp24p/erv25p- protein [Lithohypha guttulata]